MRDESPSRRFRQATGHAPVQYVRTLRIEKAKQILEQNDTAIDEVTAEIGQDDPAHFRRLFKRLVGATQARCRRRVSLIAPAVA